MFSMRIRFACHKCDSSHFLSPEVICTRETEPRVSRMQNSLCLRERTSLRSSRLSLPRFGSDRPRIFRRRESILKRSKSKYYVWLQGTSYFCARLVTKTEGHPSHTMARSPATQMTWKLLPCTMRRASPAQSEFENGVI